MIKNWYAINTVTGEYFETIEPIPFKRFLVEAKILTDFAKNYMIRYTN